MSTTVQEQLIPVAFEPSSRLKAEDDPVVALQHVSEEKPEGFDPARVAHRVLTYLHSHQHFTLSIQFYPFARKQSGRRSPTLTARAFANFLYDLWLFTESDFFTFVGPDTAFGIFGALAGPLLLDNPDPSLKVLSRVPAVILYNWTNLVVFDLANQRHPQSMEEDRINNPHRPLPSGRWTPTSCRRLLLVCLAVVLAINYLLGPWIETILLFTLTWMYNDLGGGDEDFIVRNLIIGLAFGLYNAGSLQIAGGPQSTINEKGVIWICIISMVIFTTMHAQDLKDQAGARSGGRRTAPIVLGDFAARVTIAIPIAVWSVVCPLFWRMGLEGYILTVPLGGYIIWRLYMDRTVAGDRRTWKLWTLWIALLYLLPTVKQISSGQLLEWRR